MQNYVFKHVITKLQTNHQRDQNVKLHIFLKTGIVCQFLSKKKSATVIKYYAFYRRVITAASFQLLNFGD